MGCGGSKTKEANGASNAQAAPASSSGQVASPGIPLAPCESIVVTKGDSTYMNLSDVKWGSGESRDGKGMEEGSADYTAK